MSRVLKDVKDNVQTDNSEKEALLTKTPKKQKDTACPGNRKSIRVRECTSVLGNGKAEDLFSGQDRAFDEHGYISCGPGKEHLAR